MTALAFSHTEANLTHACNLRNALDALDAGEPARIARSLSLFTMNAPWLRDDADEMARTSVSWSDANVLTIRAGIAGIARNEPDAIRLLRQALGAYEAIGQGHGSVPVRLRLGELIGGAEGERLQIQAENELRDQGIADPRSWTRMIVPEIRRSRAS